MDESFCGYKAVWQAYLMKSTVVNESDDSDKWGKGKQN